MKSWFARTSGAFLLMFLIFGLAPRLAEANVNLDVYKVEIDGSEISDTDSIYVRDDALIKLSFRYTADSDTEVDEWQVFICGETGVTYDRGDFSGSSATISFTTGDMQTAAESSTTCAVGDGGDLTYSYEVLVKAIYTTKTTTTDGDDDDDDDYYYDDTTGDEDDDVEHSPTQSLTIHVDMERPETVTLLDNPVPGEGSLLVSWDPNILSESGEAEQKVKVTFCYRRTDGQEDGVVEDGDETADTSSTTEDLAETENNIETIEAVSLFALRADGDTDNDPDAEPEAADGDEDTAETDDEADTELETDEATDGDEAVDGDEATDGDDDAAEAENDADAEPETDDVTDGDETVDGDDATDGDDDSSEEMPTDCTPFAESGAEGGSHRITGLTNGVEYEIFAKAIDYAGNESRVWSDPITGTPLEVDNFWEAYKKAGGKESGGFCFIATAAYGSYSAEQVQLFRTFRDRVLARSASGRWFIGAYYHNSQPLARLVAERPVLRNFARILLFPLVLVLTVWFQFGLPALLVAFGGCALALFGIFRFLRLRGKEVHQ